MSTKPAESFSVLSARRQDVLLHSFWESSFHSRTLLQATLALSLVASSFKSVCCDFSIFSAVMPRSPGLHTGVYVYHCHMLQRNSKETVWKLFTIVLRPRPHHCVRRPHRCLANSGTFQVQTHFPGPGNFTNTIPGLSRRHGNPVIRFLRNCCCCVHLWNRARALTYLRLWRCGPPTPCSCVPRGHDGQTS